MAEDKITDEEQNEIDHLESIKSYTKSRINNPIILAYLISWVVFNWKFLLFIIFSDLKMEERFHHTDEYLSVWSWVVPFVAMLFYTFGMDWAEGYVDSWKNKGKDYRRKQRKRDAIEIIKMEKEIADEKIKLLRAKNTLEKIDNLSKLLEKSESLNKKRADQLSVYQQTLKYYFDILSVDEEFKDDLETKLNRSAFEIIKESLTEMEFNDLFKLLIRDGVGSKSKNELMKILINRGVFDLNKTDFEHGILAVNFGKYIINRVLADDLETLENLFK